MDTKTLKELVKINPNVRDITVYTNDPGVYGWVAVIRYTNNTYSTFTVPMADLTTDEMTLATKNAIIKHLQDHKG